MPDLNERIEKWRRDMIAAGIKDANTLDELEEHLRDRIEEFKLTVSEEAAFEKAAQKIGEGRLLKQEFARARRWTLRNNPAELNIIGGWFVFAGAASVASAMCVMSLFSREPNTEFLLCLLITSLPLGVKLFAGAGLLRRSRWCRIPIMVMAVIIGLLNFESAWVTIVSPPDPRVLYLICGMFLPQQFEISTCLAEGILMFWTVWFLSRPATRELFRDRRATQVG